jgi:hypothetical protein
MGLESLIFPFLVGTAGAAGSHLAQKTMERGMEGTAKGVGEALGIGGREGEAGRPMGFAASPYPGEPMDRYLPRNAAGQPSSFANLHASNPSQTTGSFADQLMRLRQQQAEQYLQPRNPYKDAFMGMALAASGRPELVLDYNKQRTAEDAYRQQNANEFINNEQRYSFEQSQAALKHALESGSTLAGFVTGSQYSDQDKAVIFNALVQRLQTAGKGDEENYNQGALANLYYQTVSDLRKSGAIKGPGMKAPETRSVQRGNQVITQEFDPYSGWQDVGTGPKWQPGTGAGEVTPTQQANNAEIDSARARLLELGRTLPEGQTLQDAIQENMAKLDPITGLPQPGYNPFLDTIARTSMQHKVGDDPEHQKWSRIIMSPYGAIPPVPEVQQPDLKDSGTGQAPTAGQGTFNFSAPAPHASPRPTGGPLSLVEPAATGGSNDISQMSVPELGQLFQDPNLTQAQRDEISARLSALGY